jgi:hypothetical protein
VTVWKDNTQHTRIDKGKTQKFSQIAVLPLPSQILCFSLSSLEYSMYSAI